MARPQQPEALARGCALRNTGVHADSRKVARLGVVAGQMPHGGNETECHGPGQMLVEAHSAICRPPGTRRLPSRPSSAARGAVEVPRIGDDVGGAPEVKRVAANRPREDCFRAIGPLLKFAKANRASID